MITKYFQLSNFLSLHEINGKMLCSEIENQMKYLNLNLKNLYK